MNYNGQLHKIETVATKKRFLHNSDLHNLSLLMDGINLMAMVLSICC